MATFSASAEILTPAEDPLNRRQGKRLPPGFILADVLRHAGGAYQVTTAMSAKFRDCIRAVANLTSDEELLRIADLPQVTVPMENCRHLGPRTCLVMVCRLDVSPAETPRWRRIPPSGIIPPWPQGEFGGILGMCRGARIEERTLLNGISLLRMGPAQTSRHDTHGGGPLTGTAIQPDSNCPATIRCRPAADAGAVRWSSGTMDASACLRRMLATVVGIPCLARKRARSATPPSPRVPPPAADVSAETSPAAGSWIRQDDWTRVRGRCCKLFFATRERDKPHVAGPFSSVGRASPW